MFSWRLVIVGFEIIYTASLLLFADSRMVVVSYKQKYMHEVLVNRLVKLAQEKSVVRWINRPDMTIAVGWDVKLETKTVTDKNMHFRVCAACEVKYNLKGQKLKAIWNI